MRAPTRLALTAVGSCRSDTVITRRRPADVLAVYDSVAEADAAAAILARRGITGARITAVVSSADTPVAHRSSRRPERLLVLLRGRPDDTDRAHEILADAAARAEPRG